MRTEGLHETEASLVATVVHYPDLLDEIDVTFSDFLDADCSLIYRTASFLREKGKAVSVFSMVEKLSKRIEHARIVDICDMTRATPSAINELSRIVRSAAILRRLDAVGKRYIELAQSAEDPSDALDEAEKAFVEIANSVDVGQGPELVADGLITHWDEIEKRYSHRGEMVGIPTGLQDIDRLIGGWQETDFVIIAARPSMGKTALMLHAAYEASENALAVIFSAEMGKSQLYDRMLASKSSVSLFNLRNGLIEDEQFTQLANASSVFNDRKLYVDDTSMITMRQIRAKLRKLRRQLGDTKMVVFLDYLQLVRQKGRSRVEEVTEISQACKAIAKDLNCTFVALSQLSRECEKRGDKRPMLSDLRDSGSIEQDADIVAFLYRDEYYNAETEKKNVAEFIVAKNRNGPTGTAELVFLKQNQSFVNLAKRS